MQSSRLCSQTILSKISRDEIHWVHQNSVYKANIDQLSAISEATERGMEDAADLTELTMEELKEII